MKDKLMPARLLCLIAVGLMLCTCAALAQTYLDNQAVFSNQDPNTETRRSDHFRVCFGHYNRDGGINMSEELAQGNLQMFEAMYTRWFTELGMHSMAESADPSKVDGNLYRTNFNFLMTWNDGGGGGAWMGYDSNGFGFAMANPGYCRYDPPSGATPHEMGHAWEAMAGGFNGSDSSGAWWECTANWMMLQLLNGYPQPGALAWNPMYYPAHGRDYYDTYTIYEAARDDSRYGTAWVNRVWTDYTLDQQAHEYIIDRMLRIDNNTGAADRPGAVKDLWGDMAKKMITMDYERQRWFAQILSADDGSDWSYFQRCRTPLVKMAGTTNWYRPERSHTPMEYGYNIINLTGSAGTTVTCNFQPVCDPVRQSDWRACLVAVNTNGGARYSALWNIGPLSMTLSSDENRIYLVVIAVPSPMKPGGWNSYTTDAGLQFPYTVSFTNATPRNTVWPTPSVTWKTFTNADGTRCTHVQSSATVDTTCYVSPNAMILDSAQVKNYARVEDYAVVRNNAQVRDYAVISGHAVVQDNAQVYGNAKVRDWGRAYGNARVYDNAKVIEHANVGENGNVLLENAICKGTTYLYSPSNLTGCIIMDGDTANGNGIVLADHGVHFGWQWGQNTSIFGQLTDNQYVYAQHDFERDNPIFAMDKYGINHGFLMNGCRGGIDADRGGLVLPLNGTNQYVELHNSDNDFRETAYTIWVKWTGTAGDQRIWSMGDGASKQMYLTPRDSTTGNLRFVISNGTTTQYLNGPAPLSSNWTHIAVTFGSPVFNTTTRTWSATGTLYVNGVQVDTLTGMLVPDSLNAANMENANYIGRGNSGNYLQGCIDDFRVYMKTLAASDIATLYASAAPSPLTIVTDTTAPYPNAATWLAPPTALSDSAITMSAAPGRDAAQSIVTVAGTSATAIQGTVTDASGTPISGATVWLCNDWAGLGTPSPTLASVKTDASGNYTYTAVSGSWHIRAEAGGYASSATQNVTVDGVAMVPKTNFYLEKASLWVEYYFTCTSGGGHDSGWISMNKYTDVGLTPNTTYTYTVKMRDKAGNITSTSAVQGATTQLSTTPTASFAYGPVGISSTSATMTATKQTSPSGLVEYKFTRYIPGSGTVVGGSSWQSSATWTDNSTSTTSSFNYTIQVRDGRGNTSAVSAKVLASGGDHAAPLLPITVAHWQMMPYATINNAVCMTAMPLQESGAYVSYECTSGDGPDSGWIACTTTDDGGKSYYAKWTSAPVADGTYSYHYRLKDAAGNISSYSTTYSTKVTPTTGYHSCGLNQLEALPDDYLVCFTGTVIRMDNISYLVKDIATGATIKVKGNRGLNNGSNNEATDPALAFKNISVKGHLYTLAGVKLVTYATIAVIGDATMHTISGRVTSTAGGGIAGATVYVSDASNASQNPSSTAIADANGYYSVSVPDGTWYTSAGANDYYPSAEQTVTMNGADVSNINFVLTPMPRISGRVTDARGSGIAGATVCFANTANAVLHPIFSVLTDSQGYYSRGVSAASWYVGAYATNFVPSSDLTIDTTAGAVGGVNFTLNDYVVPPTLVFLSANSLADGTLSSWANTGILGGNFGNDGTTPTVETLAGRKCVTFANNDRMKSSFTTPAGITGRGDWSVAVWAYNPGIGGEECMVSWADRSGGSRCMQFNYGSAAGWGAATHMANDLGWANAIPPAAGQWHRLVLTYDGTIEKVYVDGELNNTSLKTLNLFADEPIFLGCAFSPGPTPTNYFDGSLAGIRIIDTAMSDKQVLADYFNSEAVYVATPYTITATAGAGGTITPAGDTTVYAGTSQTYTIAPDYRYGVQDVLVDGVSQGAIASYTFSEVSTNHTISVTFVPVPISAIAHYKFDESSGTTASDSSGSNKPGTLIGPCAWVSGKYNNGLSLNGSSAYVSLPSGLMSSVGDFTIATWVKLNSNAYWSRIFDFGSGNGSYMFLCLRGNDGIRYAIKPPGQGEYACDYNTPFATGVWKHVAVTQAGSTVTIYIDGVQVAQNTNLSPKPSILGSTTQTWIGRSQYNDPYLNGILDDFIIIGTALSATEVSQLYSASSLFTITASATSGGSITPSGASSVNYGSNKSYTITPAAGCMIVDVKVDGVSRGAITSYTFYSVSADHTISATFGKPIGVNNRTFLADAKLAGQFVRVWGKVKSVNGTTSFTISDGHSTPVTVMINDLTLPAGFGTTKTATVTGTINPNKTIKALDIRIQ